MLREFELLLLEALVEILRFAFTAAETLLDRCDLARLRFQAAADALGFDAKFGQLLARFGQLRFDGVGVLLKRAYAAFSLSPISVFSF